MMKATIVTHHPNTIAARSIERSFKADNEAAPKPLRVRSRAKGRRIISTVTGAQDLESLLSTMDDLMLCLIPANRVLSAIKR